MKATIHTLIGGCLLSIALCVAAVAQEKPHESKASVLKAAPVKPVPVDFVAEDLQALVVLCATEPHNAGAIDKQWRARPQNNYRPGMDIDEIVLTILNNADEYNREQVAGAHRRDLQNKRKIQKAFTGSRTNMSARFHGSFKSIIDNRR